MVRIPIATSIKNVEKPVTLMVFNLKNNLVGFSNRSVFRLLPKWVSIIKKRKYGTHSSSKTGAHDPHIQG